MSAIPRRRPVVLALHGFTLGGAMFHELAGMVVGDVIAPDLPGHGGRDGSCTNWVDAVAEVANLIETHEPELVLGYSMGGRLALGAVVARPAATPLLVVSSGLGIADVRDRAARAAEDEALAARIEAGSAEEFIAGWEQGESIGGHEELRAIRRRNTAAGMAAALRGMGQGAQPYLGNRLDQLGAPSVWIAGAADSKYVAIARQAADVAPDGSCVIVPDARHNVIAAAPGAVAGVVNRLVS